MTEFRDVAELLFQGPIKKSRAILARHLVLQNQSGFAG
jgi:hypothetical protein